MKSFQERLFKDFDVRQELQKNGRVKKVYVYKGEYAVWEKTGEELKRYKRLHRSAGLLLCLLYIWAALQRVPLNAWKLTGCFTLLSLAALAVLIMGVYQFSRSEEKMYVRDCRIMRDEILWASMIYFLLQTVNVIAGIIYVILNGISLLTGLALLAYGVTALLALVLFLAQNRMKYRVLEKQKNTYRK